MTIERAIESFMYQDPCEAAAIRESLETGCRACVFRGFDKDLKPRCGANQPLFPEGAQKSCTFWRKRGKP